MDFGLFDTWNALYAGDKVPWDPAYAGGEMLESEAYDKNFEIVDLSGVGGLGLYLARRRPLFHASEHGPSGSHAVGGHRRAHEKYQDRIVDPPPIDEAGCRGIIGKSAAS